MSSPKRRRAYSYLRFSSPAQAKGDSFRRQTVSAGNYAKAHNLVLDESLTFHDLGVSAYQGVNSETGQLGTLLEAVQVGLIPKGSVILVESLDRISRQTARKALRVIESILEAGVSVVTLTDNREYTSECLDNDPLSLLLALLTFIRANEESNTKSQRIAAVWAAKREQARERPMTSKCPGWIRMMDNRQGFELIPEHAATISRVFREVLAGKSIYSITRGLNSDAVPVQNGGGRKAQFWHTTSVSLLLKNRTVIGTLTPHGVRYVNGKKERIQFDSIDNYYPAAISKDDFERVQSLLRASSRIDFGCRQRTYPVHNILANLCKCALCGSAVIFNARHHGGRYLVCRRAHLRAGCKFKTIKYQKLENVVARLMTKGALKNSRLTSDIVREKFAVARGLLCSNEIDRPAANTALRAILTSVDIDPFEEELVFHWKHGEPTIIKESISTDTRMRGVRFDDAAPRDRPLIYN